MEALLAPMKLVLSELTLRLLVAMVNWQDMLLFDHSGYGDPPDPVGMRIRPPTLNGAEHVSRSLTSPDAPVIWIIRRVLSKVLPLPVLSVISVPSSAPDQAGTTTPLENVPNCPMIQYSRGAPGGGLMSGGIPWFHDVDTS